MAVAAYLIMDPIAGCAFIVSRVGARIIDDFSMRRASMFQQWIKNIQQAGDDSAAPDVRWVERVSALLLVEIARSDTNIDATELDTIRQALQTSAASMDAADIDKIIETAQQDADAAVSLHTQIRQINEGFSREQKLALVEQMWRVAVADGDLDKYEEHTIRKLCGLIYVNHRQFIQAKLKVMQA